MREKERSRKFFETNEEVSRFPDNGTGRTDHREVQRKPRGERGKKEGDTSEENENKKERER